jgi:hypothetical protein
MPVLRFLVRQGRCSAGRFGGADERLSSGGHSTVRSGHEAQGDSQVGADHGHEVQNSAQDGSEEQEVHSSNGKRECSDSEGLDGLLIMAP